MQKRSQCWLLWILQVFPSLAVLIIGARYISVVPLWTDELWVWAAVRGGLGVHHGELFQLPLYTVHWVLSGGGACLTEACLRWPGLVANSATVLLVGLIARRTAGPRAGLAASWLLMGIAIVHRSTLEAHHYAISAMLVAITLYSLQIVIGKPDLRWPWWLYGLALCLAGAFQPVALAAIGGHAVLLLQARQQILRRRWFITLAACSPLAIAAGFIYLTSGGYGSAATHGELIPNLENLSQAVIWPVSGGYNTLPAVGVIAGILLMLALQTPQGRRWLFAGATSMGLVYVVSLGPRDFWFGRFLWPLISFFIVAAAITFASLGIRRSVGLIALVGALCYPLFIASLAPWSRGADFRTAMSIVDENWQPGDAFKVSSVNDQWGMERYGSASGYQTVSSNTSSAFNVWSIGSDEPCSEAESWRIGPEVTLWRCPAITEKSP